MGKHLPKLDGIRAIAAGLVVVYHVGLTLIPGGTGVLIFFVLSGFLITWLLLQEHQKTGTISIGKFYARRSLRIFPAFYAFWLVVTGYTLWRGLPVNWPQGVSSLFYVSNYYQGLNHYPQGAYSHTWSLAVEEQFYLLYPVGMLLLLRSPRRVPWVLGGIILAVWALRLTAELVLGIHNAYIYTAFEMRADHLLIGCLLAVLLHRGYLDGAWRFFQRFPAGVLLTTGLLALSIIALKTDGGTRYRDVVGFIVDPLLVAVLLLQLLASGRSALTRWLDNRVLSYLGTISYPMYLYHGLVVAAAQGVMAQLGAPIVISGIMSGLAVVAAASASYHLVEKPILRLKSRFATASHAAELRRD
jgi:peptidoglycan/LPS O-acetylase OafA/YrhL